MKKLIVLDFETAEVHVYQYDENVWESPEDFTDKDGAYVITESCQWMVVADLNIQIH